MAVCPRCQASIAANMLECPRCRLPLKAHGHPGIPLHQATRGEYLCDSCQYHYDDSCNFPQRPLATTCTLYQNQNLTEPQVSAPSEPLQWQLQRWLSRHAAGLAVAGLLLISLVLVLIR